MNMYSVSDELAKAERRWAADQALASSCIEGYIPTPEFMADREAMIEGTLTLDQMRAASLRRALAADLAAVARGFNVGGVNRLIPMFTVQSAFRVARQASPGGKNEPA